MIELIEQFGGKKDVFLLGGLVFFLFLLCSLIINNKLRLIFSFFASFFICLQVLSLYFTQSFIGYQFFVHFNLMGGIGLYNLFIPHLIIFFCSLLILLFFNFYSKYLFKNNKRRQLINVIKVCSAFLILLVVIIQGNFIRDSKSLLTLFSSPDNYKDFKEVLKKHNMSDYVSSNQIVSKTGKNIIVISMESLERGFLTTKYAHLTPNLNKLKDKWNYIEMNENAGSNWTSGSLYTYLTGFPALFGVDANNIFQSAYHSNISSITEALDKADYETVYLNGNADHSGVKEMLNILNMDKIIDYKNVEKTGYESRYGIRDKDLFSISKREVRRLKSINEPFAMFISTTDTHFPNGIYDERMEAVISQKDSDMEFMVASLDYMIGDFITFLEDNDIINNTAIFLFPDHLKMGDPSMFDNTGERELYLITNSKNIGYKNEKVYQIDLPKIILKGADVKHNLKFLTDYIIGDKGGFINDNLHTITEINTSGILNSKIEKLKLGEVSKNYINYKKDTLRFIAHAGGKIDGHTYTNSKEALDLSYKRGFRLFELDILQTKDGKFVAADNWKHWSRLVGYNGETPIFHEQFIKKKIISKYTPLDMDQINNWFTSHKDAILITDKINNPKEFSEAFIDKNRLMMKLYNEEALNVGLKEGILSAIPSQAIVNKITKKDIKELTEIGVKNIVIDREFIKNNKELLLEFKKHNIKAFAYGMNSEFGIDEEYVVKYEMDYIYGIYADQWKFK